MIRRVPVRWRLSLAFALAMALLLAGAGLVLRLSLAHELDQTVDGSLRTRADEVAGLVASAGGAALAGPEGARLSEAEEGFAQVLDPAGRVVGATSPALGRPLLTGDDLRRARAGPLLVEVDPAPGTDDRARLLARPVGGDVVVVGASLDDRDEAVAGLTRLLLVGGPIALVLASALGYALAAAALRPVDAMRRVAAAVSGGRPGERLPVPEARDELRRLGQTLNQMLERIDGALERERAFVADASHELRTPLAILRAEIELALAGNRAAPELRAALVSAQEETERLTRLAEDLLVLARAEGGRLPIRPETVSARDLLEDVARTFRPRATEQGRAIEVISPSDALVAADRLRIEQALGNLVDNALRHGAGTITLSAIGGDDGAELTVADQGPGLDGAFAERAFERFTRADPARGSGGAGLGLAIVRAVARAHGGDATLATSPRGALVGIRLPGSAGGAPPSYTGPAASAGSTAPPGADADRM